MKASTKIVALTLTVLLGPAIGRAYAVTIRDLVELSREGVSDPVLIALIETDGSRFRLTPDDIRSVRAQGLSDLVIVAMIRTRAVTGPPRDGVATELPVEPVERSPVAGSPRQEPVVVQVQSPPVTVHQTVVQRVEVERPQRQAEPVYVPVYIPVRAAPVEEKKKEEPVYWGWGGQRRPDAWKEPVIK